MSRSPRTIRFISGFVAGRPATTSPLLSIRTRRSPNWLGIVTTTWGPEADGAGSSVGAGESTGPPGADAVTLGRGVTAATDGDGLAVEDETGRDGAGGGMTSVSMQPAAMRAMRATLTEARSVARTGGEGNLSVG